MHQVEIQSLDFLILSIVVLFVGMRLTRAVPLLERNYIPPAVTGGLLFSVGAALETSTVEKRPVRTGGVGDNEIAVLEGLEEDDIIATAGVPFLRDGQQVTLLGEQLLRNAR